MEAGTGANLSNMFGGASRIARRLKPGLFLVFPLIVLIVFSSSSVADLAAPSVVAPLLADAAAAAPPAAAAEVPLAERPLSVGNRAEGEEDNGVNGEKEGVIFSALLQGEEPVRMPKLKGLRTTVAAATMLILFLVLHLATVGKDLDKVISLSDYDNRFLASVCLLAGMLFSGLGDLFNSYKLRSAARDGVHPRKWKGLTKRGMPQMALGAVLYVAMIAGSLGLGTFAGTAELVREAVSLFAAGLFYWGAALYVDPWGIGNDN